MKTGPFFWSESLSLLPPKSRAKIWAISIFQMALGILDLAQSEALSGIKADNIIEEFDKERTKRGFLQYETTVIEKHSKAMTSLSRARNFIFEMKKLIQ